MKCMKVKWNSPTEVYPVLRIIAIQIPIKKAYEHGRRYEGISISPVSQFR